MESCSAINHHSLLEKKILPQLMKSLTEDLEKRFCGCLQESSPGKDAMSTSGRISTFVGGFVHNKLPNTAKESTK